MMRTAAKPHFAATSMAYMPYRDPESAARIILENFREAPCLPVLSRSIRHMLEGIPCLVLDREKRTVSFDLSREREYELVEFYEHYEKDDLDYFATSRKTAEGYFTLLERLGEGRPAELKWVAFQSAGPVLLADTLKQNNGTAAFHNETLRDVLTKAVNMKSRWLVKKIREYVADVDVIAGLPETTLVSFTSAGGSGSREELIRMINEGFRGIQGLRWVHCCANIDWSLLTQSEADVINFDAYQHAEKIALFHEDFKTFLERGGTLAWGIVPVRDEILETETVPSLMERLEQGMNLLIKRGVDEELLCRSSWIMPCCDVVMLAPEKCDLAFKMTAEISEKMREKYK